METDVIAISDYTTKVIISGYKGKREKPLAGLKFRNLNTIMVNYYVMAMKILRLAS